ncbi:MAG: hypothetical protein JJE04_18450 [Acidobacteriia bacterium]|nr:hypothetical protein [Terriglobia bacterium]
MSVQIFLQGKLLGIEEFVLAPAPGLESGGEAVLAGRSQWVSLLSEVLPRALLAELGLARILLGSSGGGGFLLVLPAESLPAAKDFLVSATNRIHSLSGGHLQLIWSATENLGDWTIVRKRLSEQMSHKQGTVREAGRLGLDQPFTDPGATPDATKDTEYFSGYLSRGVRNAQSVGWSPEDPGKILIGEGKHTWAVGLGMDAIPMARHAALDEDGATAAPVALLASRAQGRPVWGVLRGDVDNFGVRMRRMNSIEEQVRHSVLFKQLFAGELEVICSMADFWRKVTILYSGGDDFAVYGSWDALLLMAKEMQRLFHRFAEDDLKELPGPEGKTITMALALAPEPDSPFAFVYEEAGRNLETAKSTGKDCLHIFGKTIEWKQLLQAGEIKDIVVRMVRDFGCSPQLLREMSSFYRDKPPARDAGREQGKSRADRPWRYHRRLSMIMGPAKDKDKEFQRLKSALIADVIGKSPVQVKLRPAGRVAVEWARLLIEA